MVVVVFTTAFAGTRFVEAVLEAVIVTEVQVVVLYIRVELFVLLLLSLKVLLHIHKADVIGIFQYTNYSRASLIVIVRCVFMSILLY